MVDFGNFIDRKWTVGAEYYFLPAAKYNELKALDPDLAEGFEVNDDGNYYISLSSLTNTRRYEIEEAIDYLPAYFKCLNSRQGANAG